MDLRDTVRCESRLDPTSLFWRVYGRNAELTAITSGASQTIFNFFILIFDFSSDKEYNFILREQKIFASTRKSFFIC
jgi:hypothetical protein